MERRLLPINALLGLVLDGDVNPAPLADMGYHVAGLEVPIISRAGTVTIDVVCANGSTGHLIVFKPSPARMRRASKLSDTSRWMPRTIVHATYVTMQAEPYADVVYVCLDEHRERIERSLDLAGAPFPVLTVGKSTIDLVRREHASEAVRSIFGNSIVLNGPPARFLPFDQDSPSAAIKPAVKAALVAMLSRRVPHVSLTALTEAAVPHYVLFARRSQGVLQRKVAEVARELATEEQSVFEYCPRTNNRDGMVRLTRTPEDCDPRGRTQAYQALARGRRRRPPTRRVDPDQMDLLEELDRTGPESHNVSAEHDDDR